MKVINWKWLAWVLASLLLASDGDAQEKSITGYFPDESHWESVAPEASGWDSDKLNEAINFAMSRRSSSVVVLLDGKILAERHGHVKRPSLRYRGLLHGYTPEGHALEDVASCQKSVTSILVGIAQERKLLDISDPVHKYLGVGWSKANASQEAAITIKHLLSMTSGLTDSLEYRKAAGDQWRYNTPAYSRCLQVIEQASGKSSNEYTHEWLTGPLGMKDSKWVKRKRGGLGSSASARYGLVTTARDLARFGLMVSAEGKWNGAKILGDAHYLREALQSSQELNPAYGYLWWLNGKKARSPGKLRFKPTLISTASNDLFGAFGALGRKCYVVPSQNLVVVRLGDSPEKTGEDGFQEQFWKLLSDAH